MKKKITKQIEIESVEVTFPCWSSDPKPDYKPLTDFLNKYSDKQPNILIEEYFQHEDDFKVSSLEFTAYIIELETDKELEERLEKITQEKIVREQVEYLREYNQYLKLKEKYGKQ